jgi:hypothetical protein
VWRVRTYHGLYAFVVDDEIRIALVEDGVHASIDDLLQIWTRSTHPVASRGKIIVDVVIDYLPCCIRANFGRHRCIVEVVVKRGRVRVWVLRKHVIHIPVSRKWPEHIIVAEVLSPRAHCVVPPIITCRNLRLCEYTSY